MIDESASAPVPSVSGQVDPIADEAHAFTEQPLTLLRIEPLHAPAVRAHDPMPGHRSAVQREHPAHLPGRARAHELGNVAVGHDPTGRNRFDAAQDALGYRIRRGFAQRGCRPVSATSRASVLALSPTVTGGSKAPVAAKSPKAFTTART